jgi:hypothetical protein
MEKAKMSDKRKNNTQDPNQYANALQKRSQSPRFTAAEALTRGFGGAVKSVDAAEFERIAQNFNLNGQVIELVAGQAVEGTLVGRGPVLTVHNRNPETGVDEEKPLETWEFDVGGGIKVAIWTSFQLERDLPPLVGKYITVIRMQDVNVKGGKRVTKYAVGVLKDDSVADAEVVA